ncbi:MAG: hypothetical protein CVU64_04180 [Deltaproteobacteria bacterium HGW-Deltaproteobacteria-21]|jgi:hypothetical protein|nr:MAG: hypothetical protein CVU64_04180 [Deltaproteobacteria bacterium HGW-Deltaproteobacteria-21]
MFNAECPIFREEKKKISNIERRISNVEMKPRSATKTRRHEEQKVRSLEDQKIRELFPNFSTSYLFFFFF